MSHIPVFTDLTRIFGAENVEVIQKDPLSMSVNTHATIVCVTVHTDSDRTRALALLKESPDSVVLFKDTRYWPDGSIERSDPVRPVSITEFQNTFDSEYIRTDWPGPRARLHVFTYTEQMWSKALLAMRHLLDRDLLSPQSYVEGKYGGSVQGLSARRLDAEPHGPALVALFREEAYHEQNREHALEDGSPLQWDTKGYTWKEEKEEENCPEESFEKVRTEQVEDETAGDQYEEECPSSDVVAPPRLKAVSKQAMNHLRRFFRLNEEPIR